MIHAAPALERADLEVVELIQALRESLGFTLGAPRRWRGLLRRSMIGRAIRGSNSIEGYRIERRDVVAAAEGESVDANEETARATEGYRRAMTYMLQLARDRHFDWSEHVIKSLHYMMLEHEIDKDPGQWRPGAIWVFDDERQEQVYEGPDFALVPGLMQELVKSLERPDEAVPDLVRAAMAHLNLTMIHPFRDGNGRMARCLQTLVLGRAGTLEPLFSSIEEYLGRNQEPYYNALAEVGKGAWHPNYDALPFVRFCLRAHYFQAQTHLRRLREGESLWTELQKEIERKSLPERTAFALWDAAQGFKVVNGTYRLAADISQPLASRELTLLVESGLLEAVGEKRARWYRAARPLLEIQKGIAIETTIPDPYPQLLLRQSAQPASKTGGAAPATFTQSTTVSSATGSQPPRGHSS